MKLEWCSHPDRELPLGENSQLVQKLHGSLHHSPSLAGCTLGLQVETFFIAVWKSPRRTGKPS